MLYNHYINHYSYYANSLFQSTNTTQSASNKPSSNVNFILTYKKKHAQSHNELEKYFKLQYKDFDLCNPLEWWVGWQAQFPNYLYCLARDILSILSMFFF
jgi:hypothetical protein